MKQQIADKERAAADHQNLDSKKRTRDVDSERSDVQHQQKIPKTVSEEDPLSEKVVQIISNISKKP